MLFDMPSCGGCRTCEMACSFRHRKEFIPAISSIEILDKRNEPGYLISLFEKNEGERIACNGCKNLKRPLCLQYCQKDKDLKKILKKFLATVEVKKNRRGK